MRRFDDTPLDPDAEFTLAVIDATLAGEAVDPAHAELAELTLILAGQRSSPSPEFVTVLDGRVAGRFAARPGGSGRLTARRRRWLYAPGAAVGVATVVAVAIVLSSGTAVRRPVATDLSAPAVSSARLSRTSAAAGAGTAGASAKTAASSAGPSSAASTGVQSTPGSNTGGRQVVQSTQLSLSTRPDRVESVAQEVYGVIGAQDGVVNSSTVSADRTSNSYAQFQVSVPSSNLPRTLAELSRLRGAAVVSRTDASQDITGAVGGAGRRLADARALRTSLLRSLAAATATNAIDSLKIQIRDAEASISSELATLRGLHRQVDYTRISLNINASTPSGHPASSGSSFTIAKAAHDAGRVLVVAAGVALIALAALVPLGSLGAIVLWLALAVRLRRREQTLDAV